MYHSKQNRFRWIAVAVAVMTLTQGVSNAQQTTDPDTQAQADVRKEQKKEKKQEKNQARIDAKVRRRDGDDTGPAASTARVKAKADFQKHSAGPSSSVSTHAKTAVPTVTGKSGTAVQSQQTTTAVTQPSVAAKVAPATQVVPATVTTTTTAAGATQSAPLTTNVLSQQPSAGVQTQSSTGSSTLSALTAITPAAPAATPKPTP